MAGSADASGGVAKIFARAFDYVSSYDLRIAGESLAGEFGGKFLDANPLTFQIDPRKSITVFEYGSAVPLVAGKMKLSDQ